MPISVEDFCWEQTNDMVYIRVPLKGVHSKKVGLFTSNEYIKINFQPYFFECFLFDSIINEHSSVQIGNGEAVYKLKKQNNISWNLLHNPNAADELSKKLLREKALEQIQKLEEEKKSKKDSLNYELSHFGVKQQMKIEENNRNWIEDIKKREREICTKDIEKWNEEQDNITEIGLQICENSNNLSETNKIINKTITEKENQVEKIKVTKKNSFNEPSKLMKKSKEKFDSKSEKNSNIPIRISGKINLTFTPRIFPTPIRESTAASEDAWLKKQAEARRVFELEDGNLKEEEKNPVWLRDKGNSLFKMENYHGAINAYSQAIRMNCKMPSLYINRAACNLKLGNCMKCLEDCTKALEMLSPPVEQNRQSRIKAYIKRGTAFVKLDMFVEGLMDYEAALKLDPNNIEFKEDADRIRMRIQSSEL